MSEYRPEEDDYIAYSDDEVFIVWNGRTHFTVYERMGTSSRQLDTFVHNDIEDHDDAQGIADDWITDHGN